MCVMSVCVCGGGDGTEWREEERGMRHMEHQERECQVEQLWHRTVERCDDRRNAT